MTTEKTIAQAAGKHPQMGPSEIRVVDFGARGLAAGATQEYAIYRLDLTVAGKTVSKQMEADKALDYVAKFRALCGC